MKKLAVSELRSLSSICTNFSAVFLTSLVVPVFTGNFDVNSWPVVVLGLGLTIGSIYAAMFFAKKGKL